MQLLDERREIAVADAARELGYTPRTVYRDLKVLEAIGVPLYQEQSGKCVRWCVTETFRQRLRLTLSWPEMLALTTGRELLRGLAGTMFHEAALTALDKIRAALPKELAERAAASTDLSADGGSAHDYRTRASAIETIVAGLRRRETVEIQYRKPRQAAYTRRLVDPYHLHVQAGALYLIGWCHARRAVRVFLVDRIGEVRSTGRHFERSDVFRVGDMLQGSFGPWAGKPQRLHLRFSADAAPFVVERKVHPSQKTELLADGSLEVTLLMPLAPPLIAWVVGWGRRVTVLAPQELADRVRDEHREALATAERVTVGVGSTRPRRRNLKRTHA